MILKINDRIRNRQVQYFNGFSLSLQFDSVGSGFAFSYWFDPNSDELKNLSCIGHNHLATVEDGPDLLLTGKILTTNFKSENQKQLVTIRGFSLPGTLEQCQIPTKVYPLQSDNLSLKQIATKFIEPFGLGIIIDGSVAALMEETFDKTIATATDTVKGYLQSLTAQKNIVMSHDKYGNVVFTKAQTNRLPLADFNVPLGKSIPGTEMELDFDGQGMHSEITVVKQMTKRARGNTGESTVTNPYVPYDYRPRVVLQDSGSDVDTELAAKNLRAQELKGLKLKIKTDRWKINGKMITPNNIITVTNPEIYLYKKSKWFIEGVELHGDAKEKIAVLTCVLPEVYNGLDPVYLFQGINDH